MLYVLKIIEQNLERSIASVCSKILISKLIPIVILRYGQTVAKMEEDESRAIRLGCEINKIEDDVLKHLK